MAPKYTSLLEHEYVLDDPELYNADRILQWINLSIDRIELRLSEEKAANEDERIKHIRPTREKLENDAEVNRQWKDYMEALENLKKKNTEFLARVKEDINKYEENLKSLGVELIPLAESETAAQGEEAEANLEK